MRKTFCLLLAILFLHVANAQTSSIRGLTRDTIERKNLHNAVISLLRDTDSVLVKFTRTDADGAFNLANLPAGGYILMVTFPKMADFADRVTLAEGQTLDIGALPLTPRSVLMSEVIVRANNTMRIRGDTTEFTADSFKVKEGATVEELLKQIPGMSVNAKGEITAQGKRVDKVLVDGEEFFGDDPTIATQNIGARAVDKVQVYDTKTEQDQLKGIGGAGTGNKTINIKLKESAKKGYFGKVEGGTNFDNLVNGKLMFNRFKGSEKISVYGTKSNTNTGRLGWEERNKLGIENDYEYDELSGYYYSYGDGDDEYSDWNLRGLPNAYTAGGLYGNKWREDKHKMNLSYLYNRLGTNNTTRTESQTLLADTTYFNNSISTSRGLSQQHSINGKYEWKIDSLASIKLVSAGSYRLKDTESDSYSEALNEDREFVNTNARKNNMSTTKKQLDNILTYKQLFHKKNRQLIATFRLGLIQDEATGNLYSITNFYRNNALDSVDVIDQLKINDGSSTTFGSKITYNEPLNDKWNIVAEYSLNKNISESHRNSYEKDVDGKYTSLNQVFSNNFDLDAVSNAGTLTARYVSKKFRFGFGSGISAIRLRMNNLDLNNRTNYNFTGFTPQAQVAYNPNQQVGFSFSYRGNTVQPTISQLQPLPNNNDPLNIYIGNPNLKVGFRHNLNLNFNDYKVMSGKYIFINFGITFSDNAVTNFSRVDSFGKRTYLPVNVDGNQSWYMWSVWNSGQGDKKLLHEITPEASGGRMVNFLNGQKNINTYAVLSLRYNLRYSVQEKYNFRIGPGATRNLSKSSLRPNTNNNYWLFSIRTEGWVKLPAAFEITSDADMSFRQKTEAFNDKINIIVWNAELSKKFLKDKSLKLAVVAHDILNQNIGFNRTINSNFISEERFDRLARYFLLTASWTFNKMPGKN